MSRNINDFSYVRKIIYRKVRKNIVWAEYDLQWVSFNKKIDFALDKLKQIHFSELKIIMSFWGKFDVIQKIFEKNNCHNYSLVRKYKTGCLTPGLIEIRYSKSIDDNLMRTLIRRHYGYELGKPDGLNMDLVFIFKRDNDATICHLYDDRGFHVFHLNS